MAVEEGPCGFCGREAPLTTCKSCGTWACADCMPVQGLCEMCAYDEIEEDL